MTTPAELEHVLTTLRTHALPAVKVTPLAKQPATPTASKFGGQPWWPQGKAYPHTQAGEPLFLLAQINLAELPALPHFPRQGLLQFFIANNDTYGLDFDSSLDEVLAAPQGYRVVYHPEVSPEAGVSADQLPALPTNNLLPLTEEYALAFTAQADLPSPSDYRFAPIARAMDDMDESMVEKLFDMDLGVGSKLGGYAYFTQEDPRAYERQGENWTLLFQLDTHDEDDGVLILWGDCGVGNFFIEPERLAAGDFSRVWYNWDCC